jgi:hypothetical protein
MLVNVAKNNKPRRAALRRWQELATPQHART